MRFHTTYRQIDGFEPNKGTDLRGESGIGDEKTPFEGVFRHDEIRGWDPEQSEYSGEEAGGYGIVPLATSALRLRSSPIAFHTVP